MHRCNRGASVQFVKNPISRNTYSPVDPTCICLNTSVHRVIGRILSKRKNRFFSPRSLEKLDDWRIKSSPKELKFCRHDHKDLVNISTEGIDESLHDLGGIEEFPSKNGVFSRPQKFRIEETRDSAGFSTRLDGLESLQGVMKSSRSTHDRAHKE